MKKFFMFVLVCGVIGVILGTLVSRTPVFSMTGRAILESISQKNYEQVYVLFAPEYKRLLPFPLFKEQMQAAGLEDYKEVQWTTMKTAENKKSGYVVGFVLLKNGSRVPIEIDFVAHENPGWLSPGWLISYIKIGVLAESRLLTE